MRSMPMLQHVNLIETTVEPCYAFEATIQYNGEKFQCRYNWSFAEYMNCPFIAVRGVMPRTLEEAIRQLELEGLVYSIPNKETVVAGISEEDVQDIFLIRSKLEGLAAKQAAMRITSTEIKEITEVLELTEFYAQKL